MIGSPKQIQWAEKIKAELSVKWYRAINNLVDVGCSTEFYEILKTVYEEALNQNDAQVWIEHRDGRMYSIATDGRALRFLWKRLGWSIEEENLIGFGTLDRICEYDV